MLSCSKWSMTMTGEKVSPQPIPKERKPPRDPRTENERPEQVLPPLLNDGPESIRDSHT
jgi:hypothetical protein